MVLDIYSSLLEELSRELQIPGLQPDAHQTCLIRFPNQVRVQLELDKTANFLIVGTEIGEVPPGKYRENIFREALRANGLPSPRHGVFGYSQQANKLVLFEMFALRDLNGIKIADFLPQFIEKAKTWTEALKRGEIPTVEALAAKGQSGGGLFGLKP